MCTVRSGLTGWFDASMFKSHAFHIFLVVCPNLKSLLFQIKSMLLFLLQSILSAIQNYYYYSLLCDRSIQCFLALSRTFILTCVMKDEVIIIVTNMNDAMGGIFVQPITVLLQWTAQWPGGRGAGHHTGLLSNHQRQNILIYSLYFISSASLFSSELPLTSNWTSAVSSR